jgi:hypothetical protein
MILSATFWQTEGLKQLTSMGSLVLCCGDGAVMNSTNLYVYQYTPLVPSPSLLSAPVRLKVLMFVSTL